MKIYLHIPLNSEKYGEYDWLEIDHIIQHFHPFVQLNLVDTDYGPITKLLPLLKMELPCNNIILIDDDVTYCQDTCAQLLRYSHLRAVGYHGLQDSLDGNYRFVYDVHHPTTVDFLETYHGVLYDRHLFPYHDFFNFIMNVHHHEAACKRTDDLIISKYIRSNHDQQLYVIPKNGILASHDAENTPELRNDNLASNNQICMTYLRSHHVDMKKKSSNLMRKAAIIIEPRKHKALEFVLQKFHDALPDDWITILFHGNQNEQFVETILGNNALPRVTLVNLHVDNLTIWEYSRLLSKRSQIYDHLVDSDYFLVFQTDSMIFKQNIQLLDYFVDGGYDYVGSPWLISDYGPTRDRDFIGNGGFSLRKTETMLRILDTYNCDDIDEGHVEDMFFTTRFEKIDVKKPSYEMAMRFGVEQVFSPITLGCHKPWVCHQYAQFKDIYPECEILRSLQDVFP